ncbi:glycoside hydrolase family 19 protein [Massilia sp. CF038]|uniref:glycoside hydrolase family 19 protein n=1 Tax=Massilia sp. CF038 TaxID=1881045 RepID=UPI00091D0C77|nr:glycoside hydrolase family 19 protein [Massilia sp. CF038]SHG48491.1 putative chitinase [Massilia sp. CF038]
MNAITEAQLRLALSASDTDARAGVWAAPLNHAMQLCQIDTPVRQAAFLAQVLLESGELRQLQENLSYSVQRLRLVWPHRFPSDEAAAPFSHHPEKLANFVYAGRMGNGDEASGDGWRYRGRGLIQLTGRDNYSQFSKAMDLDALANPDLLQLPAGAALSAAWFWSAKGLNKLADQTEGSEADSHFAELTRRINGGLNGLQLRKAYWQRVQTALRERPPSAA